MDGAPVRGEIIRRMVNIPLDGGTVAGALNVSSGIRFAGAEKFAGA